MLEPQLEIFLTYIYSLKILSWHLIDDTTGGHEPGWREVPVEDPVVKDAAHHAVKSIQERSNSLFPYELLEILRAHAQVSFCKMDLKTPSPFPNIVSYGSRFTLLFFE